MLDVILYPTRGVPTAVYVMTFLVHSSARAYVYFPLSHSHQFLNPGYVVVKFYP